MTPIPYPPSLASLWAIDRLPELGPGSPVEEVHTQLKSLNLESLFPTCHDREAARACQAGLWLYFDYLDESHSISQELPSWFGSYWHGIMHRREPDAWNAKYWFRKVANNPVCQRLAQEEGLASWDAAKFVDRCERARGTGSAEEEQCRQVQRREMAWLFEWCFRRASGAE